MEVESPPFFSPPPKKKASQRDFLFNGKDRLGEGKGRNGEKRREKKKEMIIGKKTRGKSAR